MFGLSQCFSKSVLRSHISFRAPATSSDSHSVKGGGYVLSPISHIGLGNSHKGRIGTSSARCIVLVQYSATDARQSAVWSMYFLTGPGGLSGYRGERMSYINSIWRDQEPPSPSRLPNRLSLVAVCVETPFAYAARLSRPCMDMVAYRCSTWHPPMGPAVPFLSRCCIGESRCAGLLSFTFFAYFHRLVMLTTSLTIIDSSDHGSLVRVGMASDGRLFLSSHQSPIRSPHVPMTSIA